MKYLFICFLFLGFSVNAQNKSDSVIKKVSITFDEEQLQKMYVQLKLARLGVMQSDVPARNIQPLMTFNDSLSKKFETIFEMWYPKLDSNARRKN